MLNGRVAGAVLFGVVLGCSSGEQTTGFVPTGTADSSVDAGADAESAADVQDSSFEQSEEADLAKSGPPYPIVLHHGFSGWKQIDALSLTYFYDVAADLKKVGEEQVFEPQVEPYQSSEARAKQLAPQLDKILQTTGASKLNLITHSQGGLDSRYLISQMGYGDRIASLTTISTPHRGTAVADAALGWIPGISDVLVNSISDVIGRPLGDVNNDADFRASLESLSEKRAVAFNASNPNDPRVGYFSYAGRSNLASGDSECAGGVFANEGARLDIIEPFLQFTGPFLSVTGENKGANDGMVAVRSARWGTFMGCVPADHFDEIGQIKKDYANPESGFEHRAFYRKVVLELRKKGF